MTTNTEAARELHEQRQAWLNPPGASPIILAKRTLTNLYYERPAWLQMAHDKLDAAVLAAYGWPTTVTDDELLERLLALNLSRPPDCGPASGSFRKPRGIRTRE